MKIVQVMPEFGLAGAEIMCENLVYELIRHGHDVIIISMYDFHSAITHRLENAGVDIRYLRKKSGLDLSVIFKIKRILKETKADVIHTHRYCAQYAIPAAILAGVKRRVHTLHSIAKKENGKLARKLNKFFFKHCSLIPVALSELNRDSIVEEYGIKKEKIPVIFNGINLSKCKPKENYSLNGTFKILHVGRFSPEKNHIGLLQAFKLFHKNHANTELWLIGDGEKKAEIERYVYESGLASNVRFLGLQSTVYTYLRDADIFSLPSNYEGMPMTLIEAMGSGMPIVATKVGGIPNMLDEESALLISTEVEAIANAFEMYYLDENLRKTHGLAALSRAKLFSAKKMAKNYLEIYYGQNEKQYGEFKQKR